MSQPWDCSAATYRIRDLAKHKNLAISYKLHATERMHERNLIVSDVLYVLKNGFVYEPPIPATRTGYYRYAVENKSPNSSGRTVRIIIIPDDHAKFIKVVSVMWVDETSTKSGSITGEEDNE